MIKFDDREKKFDRQVNKIYLEFRKYDSEETCPFCQIYMPVFKKFGLFKEWVHIEDICFMESVKILHIGSEIKNIDYKVNKILKTLKLWKKKDSVKYR